MTRTFAKYTDERGLTLLEMLLVVAILSAVAWTSLAVVGNNSDQVRFDDTRNRLQAIRRAIIGDTSRTLNGGPEVTGYVADMGNLPAKLQALVSRQYCEGQPEVAASADCTSVWVEQPAYGYNSTYGLWAGWNGPYLRATELTGYPRVLDGWGNDNSTSNDFGWSYEIYSDGDQVHLLVQSLGRDGKSDTEHSPDDSYESDYPPAAAPPLPSQRLISDGEHRVKITESGGSVFGDGDSTGVLMVDFGSPPPCWHCNGDPAIFNRKDCEDGNHTWEPVPDAMTEGNCTGKWQPKEYLCMGLVSRSNGTVAAPITSSNGTLTWDGSHQEALFIFEDLVGPPYDEDTYLYLGQAAYGIFEYDNDANQCKCPDNPFPADAPKWEVFTCVPGRVIHPFERKKVSKSKSE